MSDKSSFEVVIIGGGIAGASVAYFLAERGITDFVIFERESQPGYHSTGHSAATLVEFDANPTVQRLKAIGGSFLRNPPAGFAENPLLQRSQVMFVFRDSMLHELPGAIARLGNDGVSFEALSSAQAVARVPVLELEESDRAILLTEDGRIDVHELLSSYLRHPRRRAGQLRTNCEVRGVIIESGRCRGVITNSGEVRARWVVDAAGAWAGEIARLAGTAPIALEPRRRTIATFEPPEQIDVSRWPFVISELDQLYFAPESGGLLLSPMDQEPMRPCDAQPDDVVIAGAIERLRRFAPRLVPRSLKRKWSGLRTFSPDSVPVVGEDPLVRGFFWLAGQQGFGIESSPSLAIWPPRNSGGPPQTPMERAGAGTIWNVDFLDGLSEGSNSAPFGSMASPTSTKWRSTAARFASARKSHRENSATSLDTPRCRSRSRYLGSAGD